MNFDSIVNVTKIVVDEVVDFVSSINYTAVFENILTTSGSISNTVWENISSPIHFTYVVLAESAVSFDSTFNR